MSGLTDAQTRKLRHLWADPRLSSTDIAKALGVSLDMLRAVSRIMGLPPRLRQAARFDPEDLRKAWGHHATPICDIARGFRVSVRTLQMAAALMGLPDRPDMLPCEVDRTLLRRCWPDPGWTLRRLAEEMGVSEKDIISAARDLGLPARGMGGPGRGFRHSVDRSAFRAAWYDLSRSIEDISREFGVSSYTISMTADAFGLPDRAAMRREAAQPRPAVSPVRPLVAPRAPHPKPGLCARPKLPELEARPADADILASKGRYSKMAEVADRHGLRPAEVQRRFHQLRAAGVTSGEGGRA